MPIKLCLERGCREPNLYRGYCAAHARERNRSTHSLDNRKVYNSKRWKVVSRSVLYNHPMCAACDERLATEVDHIVPLPEGDPYHPSNLQALCTECHSRKTRREQLQPR